MRSVIFCTLAVLIAPVFTQENTATASTTSVPTTTLPSCPELCTFPPDAGGRGKGHFRMWYFNVGAQECKTFQYTGRKGNKNRFWTRADCEFSCVRCTPKSNDMDATTTTTSTNDVCNLPLSKGTACPDAPEDAQIKWRFDSVTGACEPFAFRGCDGNDNRFDTKVDCEESCGANE